MNNKLLGGLVIARSFNIETTMNPTDLPDGTIRQGGPPYVGDASHGTESEANRSKREAKSRPNWLIAIGTVEGFSSALLTVCVFLIPVSAGTQRQSMIPVITLMGLGMGLGIGGIRFGNYVGRFVAWCSVVVLSLLSIALVGKSVWDRM